MKEKIKKKKRDFIRDRLIQKVVQKTLISELCLMKSENGIFISKEENTLGQFS